MSSGNRTIFDEMDLPSLFKWPEYCVFAAVLVLSMGIGVFYGFFNNRNKTNEEFLMASRSMSIFPVSLSLVCSFISAITIMGTVNEVFYYGMVYAFFATSAISMTVAVVFLYLPVFFNLQLTSAYAYFELRFSRRVRLVISTSAIVHLLIYMPLTTWAPSLALERVAGINKYMSSAAIYIVCIAYSSIGGLKAVLWTDALQAVIMFGSILAVIIAGIDQIGGMSIVWERARDAHRLDVWSFDFDPRTRHTFWTGVIGAYFSWIPLFAGAQAQIQRYLAVPSEKKAKLAMLCTMVGMVIVVLMCCLVGLIIFARYYDCDPAAANVGGVTTTDQLLPLFVMDGKFTGMPGLMVAGLTCGSLSSVSSALNALPAIIVEDYVKSFRPNLSDVKLGYLSKIISCVGGLVSFALIFVIALIGNVLPFASLLHGTFLGPVCAMFSLGMFFPWANGVGSVLGAICSLILTLFIGVGSVVQGNAGHLSNQKLPLRTDGCWVDQTRTPRLSVFDPSSRFNTDWKDVDYSNLNDLFGISYLWLPAITVSSAILFGLIFSIIINMWSKTPQPPVKEKYLTPLLVTIYKKVVGKERMRKWIEFEDEVDEKSPKKDINSEPTNGNNNIEKSYGTMIDPAQELTEQEVLEQVHVSQGQDGGFDNVALERED